MKKSVIITIITILVVSILIGAAVVISSNTDSKNSKVKPTTSKTHTISEKATQAKTQTETQAQAQSNDNSYDNSYDNSIDNSNDVQQNSNDEPVIPELRSIWKNQNNPEGCSIVINNQTGNSIDFTVSSTRGNLAQIATSDIVVTLDTEYDGVSVRGYSDFEYVDSFGNGGTGSISVSENAIVLVINQEFGNPGGWNLVNATGTYYYS